MVPGQIETGMKKKARFQWTEKKHKFCQFLAINANVTAACKELGIVRRTGQRWYAEPAVVEQIEKLRSAAIQQAGKDLGKLVKVTVQLFDDNLADAIVNEEGVPRVKALEIAGKVLGLLSSGQGVEVKVNQQNNALKVTMADDVWRPEWIRKRFNIHDEFDEAVDRELRVGHPKMNGQGEV